MSIEQVTYTDDLRRICLAIQAGEAEDKSILDDDLLPVVGELAGETAVLIAVCDKLDDSARLLRDLRDQLLDATPLSWDSRCALASMIESHLDRHNMWELG